MHSLKPLHWPCKLENGHVNIYAPQDKMSISLMGLDFQRSRSGQVFSWIKIWPLALLEGYFFFQVLVMRKKWGSSFMAPGTTTFFSPACRRSWLRSWTVILSSSISDSVSLLEPDGTSVSWFLLKDTTLSIVDTSIYMSLSTRSRVNDFWTFLMEFYYSLTPFSELELPLCLSPDIVGM